MIYCFINSRHNRGHVTRNQFRQCLTIVGLTSTEKEFQSIESLLMNDQGFNYRQLIELIQPNQKDKLRYQILQDELQSLTKEKILPEIKTKTNIQEILQKIKQQV